MLLLAAWVGKTPERVCFAVLSDPHWVSVEMPWVVDGGVEGLGGADGGLKAPQAGMVGGGNQTTGQEEVIDAQCGMWEGGGCQRVIEV